MRSRCFCCCVFTKSVNFNFLSFSGKVHTDGRLDVICCSVLFELVIGVVIFPEIDVSAVSVSLASSDVNRTHFNRNACLIAS